MRPACLTLRTSWSKASRFIETPHVRAERALGSGWRTSPVVVIVELLANEISEDRGLDEAHGPLYATGVPRARPARTSSPGTYRLDRIKRLRIYGREGVKHAWLLHPGERTLEVLRLESGRWTIVATQADDAVVRAEPFEAVEIDLLPLWGESRRPRKPKARAADTRSGAPRKRSGR